MLNKENKKFWKERQYFLKSYGWYSSDIDGIPGVKTGNAIEIFQREAKKKGYYCEDCLIDKDWGNETEKAYNAWLAKEELDVTNSVDFIDNIMMKDMINRYEKYVQSFGEPTKVYLSLANSFRRYVKTSKFKEMKKQFDDYYNTNKQELKTIYINEPTPFPPIEKDYLEKFADAVGKTIKNWEDVCIGIKNRKYLFYYNDVYDQKTALKRLKNKEGLNCSDICQLVYQALKDLGYDVRYVHFMCKQGGHIQLDLKGKDVGNNWMRIDPSNPLSNGGSCKNLWCASTGYLKGYNPEFLRVDDGIT